MEMLKLTKEARATLRKAQETIENDADLYEIFDNHIAQLDDLIERLENGEV